MKWPLYSREMVSVPEGLNAMDFGTITREDEKRQTTYKGWPLYYSEGDKAPGMSLVRVRCREGLFRS